MKPQMSGRILKDYNELQAKSKELGVTLILPNEANIAVWNVIIDGPAGTAYEKGKFTVEVDLRDSFPLKCPKVRFKTPIYHPNVFLEKEHAGEICDLFIKDQWNPILNVKWAIEQVIKLIKYPDIGSALETKIAEQCKTNFDEFLATARKYTQEYAK